MIEWKTPKKSASSPKWRFCNRNHLLTNLPEVRKKSVWSLVCWKDIKYLIFDFESPIMIHPTLEEEVCVFFTSKILGSEHKHSIKNWIWNYVWDSLMSVCFFAQFWLSNSFRPSPRNPCTARYNSPHILAFFLYMYCIYLRAR